MKKEKFAVKLLIVPGGEEHCVHKGNRVEVYKSREPGHGCSFWDILYRQGLHVSPKV